MTPDNDAVFRAADAACHGALETFWGDLDTGTWEPLRAAVEEARRAHQDTSLWAGLQGESPADAAEVRERTSDYLIAVAEKVHPPLLEALADGLPAERIERAVQQARELSRSACGRLPSAVEMNRSTLAAMPHDGATRRLGRSLARAVNAVSSSGSRMVDVRSVAVRHRSRRLAEMENAWRFEAARLWTVWLAELEACWAAWTTLIVANLAGESGASGEEPAVLWGRLGSACTTLDTCLEALAATCPHEPLAAASHSELARCRGLLESDLSVAGTFLLRPGSVEEKPAVAQSPGWVPWQGQAVGRMRIQAALMAVFMGVRRARIDMVDRLRGEVLEAWREKADVGVVGLRAVAETLKGQRPERQSEFDSAHEDARAVLDGLKTGCSTRAQLEAVSRRVAGMGIGAVQASLRSVPVEVVLHPLPQPAHSLRRPPRVTYTVRLQEMARQAFDTLRMERLRTSPAPLVEAGEALGSALNEISEIVAFGFAAASKELEAQTDGCCDRALELAAEALGRAAESLSHTVVPLEVAVDEMRARVTDEVDGGFGGLAARATADRMQGRLLDARSGLADALAELRRRAGPRVERRVLAIRVGWLRLLRSASRGFRWGRNLVVAKPTGPTAATRTARSLAAAEDLVGALPLVYQHLFALEPVTDPGLLAGRDVEVAAVEQKWQRWHDADGVPLLVTGRRSCGLSSFFNAFVFRLGERGARSLHRVLDHRITTEEGLATYLSRELGLEAARSLDDLAALILGAEEGVLPDLFALEGLEHVYLRVPGGTDLLERLFTLMAETEPRVFWVGSLTASAWQVVKKSEPAVAAQLDCMELSPLSAETIQAAILLRHRRSGLSLSYEEPAEGRRILRGRVRRLRGTERHQQVLQGDYFDRLHKTSQDNLRLAFFQWLRSVDFATGGDGQLVVRPLPALDFSFLDSLDLTQNFTIKAFLEHQTLTLAEHDAVFRVTHQESYHVFESLGNRHIIEAVTRPDEDRVISEVRDDIRYRIRPLLTGGVASHLASRNIVH